MSDFFALPPGHNTLAASTPAPPPRLPALSSSAHTVHGNPQPTIREILPTYLAYAEYEWRLAPKSIKDYKEGLCRLLKVAGDIAPQEVDEACLLRLKADFAERRIGPFWA